MRELRPLILPRLVAARKASISSAIIDDMASDSSRFPSSCESFHSAATSASDCSSPMTPTFSIRGHSRYPSSNSSLASSPPTHDSCLDMAGSTNKLPKLAEEPMERDEFDHDFVMLHTGDGIISPCLCDVDDCAHQPPSMIPYQAPLSFYGHSLADSGFGDDLDFSSEHEAKRRRSGDSPVSSIATRLENRFPSISRRLRERKRSSGLSIRTRNTSHSRSNSRAPSTSRTSSITGSIAQISEHYDIRPITPIKSYFELQEAPSPSDAVDIVRQSLDVEPIDREAMASTPLLPPTLMRLRDEAVPSPSPLQSPTVADPTGTFSFGNTPSGTPRLLATSTPPLSSKPSFSSLGASRSCYNVSATEIPPLKISDLEDKWSTELGHANFTIYPEPWVPEVSTAETCRQLFADWEQARHNFMKHQVRTGEHFGVTSKAYKLTEQKWAEIDAQWRKYHELTLSQAGLYDDQVYASSQIEPAPLVKLPSLTNKFPAKGDEDIVGPMVQVASQVQPSRSRKASIVKFFSDLKISSSFLPKPTFGLRTQR